MVLGTRYRFRLPLSPDSAFLLRLYATFVAFLVLIGWATRGWPDRTRPTD